MQPLGERRTFADLCEDLVLQLRIAVDVAECVQPTHGNPPGSVTSCTLTEPRRSAIDTNRRWSRDYAAQRLGAGAVCVAVAPDANFVAPRETGRTRQSRHREGRCKDCAAAVSLVTTVERPRSDRLSRREVGERTGRSPAEAGLRTQPPKRLGGCP